jgi:hypothetical protein
MSALMQSGDFIDVNKLKDVPDAHTIALIKVHGIVPSDEQCQLNDNEIKIPTPSIFGEKRNLVLQKASSY